MTMKLTTDTVAIIGAGVSGLIAATVLESYGLNTIIYEKSDRVGGRIKTDTIKGLPLDHGFQVLLTAYPMAKKYLNYELLDLRSFKPGALLYDQNVSKFGDLSRDFSFAWTTLVSNKATLMDKIKIYKLSQDLKAQSIEELFEGDDISTLQYLKNLGFSDKVIEQFFKPFYGGIFLESELKTNAKMFRFIFKMFAEGSAAIPKNGMEEIPKQLLSNLEKTKVVYDTNVEQVKNSFIVLKNGDTIESSATIVATEAQSLISNLNDSHLKWKSCLCFYFETDGNFIKDDIIGLNCKAGIVNNFHFVASDSDVMSITVIKDIELSTDKLISLIKKEMYDLCGVKLKELLKCYKIPKALADFDKINYDLNATETQLLDYVFLAGDVLLNGSLNAAMLAGERAAEAVLMKKGLIKSIS